MLQTQTAAYLKLPQQKAVAGSLTWRVGGLSKWVVSKLLSTLKGVLAGVMILISL